MSTPRRVSNRAHHTAAHIATGLTTRSSLPYRTDRIEQHYIDACPFTMMDCLFGCGARHARQDTESHAAVCPNVLAECDAGCGWRCKRVEMPSHVIICPLREAECPNKWWDQRSACGGGSNSGERRPRPSLSHSSPPRSSLYSSTAWDYSLRTYVTTIGYSSCGTVLRPGDIAEHMKVCPYARITAHRPALTAKRSPLTCHHSLPRCARTRGSIVREAAGCAGRGGSSSAPAASRRTRRCARW